MDEEQAKAAVRSFVARAVEKPRSAEEIALRFGLTSAAVGHWKTGATQPAAWHLFKIAADYHFSIDDWLGPEEDRRSLESRVEALELEMNRLIAQEPAARHRQSERMSDL